MLLKNYIYFIYASKPKYDFKFMKTFKISILWPGKSLNVLSCWPGQIYINIFSELFLLNFEQIPVHTLVKSEVDICPYQL